MEGYSSESRAGTSASRRQRDEGHLISRAKNGDKRAVSELYRRHVDTIYRYIYARVNDTAVAEDLTAQVFLKALEGLSDYESTGRPFLAWLYSIARARTADYWRKQQRRPEEPLSDTLPADDPRPEDLIDAEAEWIMAMDLLAELTDGQQEVMFLRFIGEQSLVEVAETLGKTVGAVKAIQHRALASLARLLEERMASRYYE